ncbi:MAG: cobalamin-dependent protein [Candidatus Bathyarchaeia archaeon]|jgi:5-methyltetrahydrofolate--homocysteine methyltransferase
MSETLESIAEAIANLESSQNLNELVTKALQEKVPTADILEKGLRRGLHDLGQKYEKGQFFLSELLYGASLIDQAMTLIRPNLKAERLESKGRIVLGTVRGDIHDIGKNIFKLMAEANGFDVHDLGVDVSPEQFRESVIEKTPDVLGLSSLLTTTLPEMGATVAELQKFGARDNVRILLGGNAVTDSFRKEILADAAAIDAVQGVDFCVKWVRK